MQNKKVIYQRFFNKVYKLLNMKDYAIIGNSKKKWMIDYSTSTFLHLH